MPYTSIDQLPEQTKNLPDRAKRIFLKAFNNALKEYDNEETARKVAWAAIKTTYVKNESGKWVKKEEKSEINNLHTFSMYITKATINESGEMTWQGVASDTDLDLFKEQMSVELYQSFIDKLDGTEFVSLSHYPSLDGKAELGKVTHLYIDGDKLKAKGIFYDNPLGRSAYNSIRKDRRDNIEQNLRIRISIGFYDQKHKHGNLGIWKSELNKPCALCLSGIKEKTYLEGKLEHLALTRKPALPSTTIEVQ